MESSLRREVSWLSAAPGMLPGSPLEVEGQVKAAGS